MIPPWGVRVRGRMERGEKGEGCGLRKGCRGVTIGMGWKELRRVKGG
jgi:hypothetical protein